MSTHLDDILSEPPVGAPYRERERLVPDAAGRLQCARAFIRLYDEEPDGLWQHTWQYQPEGRTVTTHYERLMVTTPEAIHARFRLV